MSKISGKLKDGKIIMEDGSDFSEMVEGTISVEIGGYMFFFDRESLPDWDEAQEEEREQMVRDLVYKNLHESWEQVLLETQGGGDELNEVRKAILSDALQEAQDQSLTWVAKTIVDAHTVLDNFESGRVERPSREEAEGMEAEYRDLVSKVMN